MGLKKYKYIYIYIVRVGLKKKKKQRERERRQEVGLGPVHAEREREREIGRDIGHGVDGDYLWSLPTYRSARSSTGEGQRAEGRGRAELWFQLSW